jgi:polysaccharide export outer membrane protein
MSETYAGVEDLQVRANQTGYAANFGMLGCAYCWVKGVESNYTDGDHVELYWGYRDEIRDSYFSNAFLHMPGTHDSDIQIGFKTSASLIENNIIERTHVSIMLEWGAAGNVIAYNYTMGEFDGGATNLVIGGIDYHGAHPQFNLIEGNVLTTISQDATWGTSSHTTAYRNWVTGTNRICSPKSGRSVIDCSKGNAHYGFQGARAIEMSYLATLNNFVGNVVGSAQMQSLTGYNYPVSQRASVEYPSTRSYDAVAYGWSFGFGIESDDGKGSGCSGGIPPCHLAGTSSTNFFHGNYNHAVGSIDWAAGVTHELPASFYLSSKPAWWSNTPFPATGPDVSGGIGPKGHSYGNPAEACYFKVMGGSDGGAGGPLTFNAGRCYGKGSQPTPAVLSSQDAAQAQAQQAQAAQVQAQIEARIRAQEAAPPPAEPVLKANPLDKLRSFEAGADAEYRLGKGDEISVDFAGRPQMHALIVVGPDGRISLPLAGEVMLAGLTRSEAAKAVESALSSYYSNLEAQVSVTKYTANRVLLLGAVEHPGLLTFDGTPTLLEAITRGGVVTESNKTGQIPERCAIYRGNDQVVWVELRALMESGNTLADLRLQRDDVIYVPSASERFVSVLGEVQHPGAIPLTYKSTLASVLAEAGGISDHAGNNPHIQIVDPATGSSRVLTLNDVLDPVKSLEVTLRPGEIVYVPKSGFYRATYVLERISPLINVASMALYTGVL